MKKPSTVSNSEMACTLPTTLFIVAKVHLCKCYGCRRNWGEVKVELVEDYLNFEVKWNEENGRL